MALGPQFNEYQKLYHGTTAAIEDGGVINPSKEGVMGKGAYATTSKEGAGEETAKSVNRHNSLGGSQEQQSLFSFVYEVEPVTPESDFTWWGEGGRDNTPGGRTAENPVWARKSHPYQTSDKTEHVVDPKGMVVKGVADYADAEGNLLGTLET